MDGFFIFDLRFLIFDFPPLAKAARRPGPSQTRPQPAMALGNRV